MPTEAVKTTDGAIVKLTYDLLEAVGFEPDAFSRVKVSKVLSLRTIHAGLVDTPNLPDVIREVLEAASAADFLADEPITSPENGEAAVNALADQVEVFGC